MTGSRSQPCSSWEAGAVLLIVAYAKSELDDIPAGHKKYFREMIARQHAIFQKGVVR